MTIMQPFRYSPRGGGFTASLETYPPAGTFIRWQGPVTAKEDLPQEFCAGVSVRVLRDNTTHDVTPRRPCDHLIVTIQDVTRVNVNPLAFIDALTWPRNHFLTAENDGALAIYNLQEWLRGAFENGRLKNANL